MDTRKEAGFALFSGLLTLLVLVMVIGAVTVIVPVHQRSVEVQGKQALALHAAESGVFHALAWLNQYDRDFFERFATEFPYKKSEDQYYSIDGKGRFSIDLTDDGTLIAYGEYGNHQRVVSIRLSTSDAEGYRLFEECLLYFEGNQPTDDNFIPPNITVPTPPPPPEKPARPPKPQLSEYQDWNGQMVIRNPNQSPDAPPLKVRIRNGLSLGFQGSLRIEGNVDLYVDGTLSLGSRASIHATGDLNLYVDGALSLGWNSQFSVGGNMHLYTNGALTLNSQAQFSVEGDSFLYVDGAFSLGSPSQFTVGGDLELYADGAFSTNNGAELTVAGDATIISGGSFQAVSTSHFSFHGLKAIISAGDTFTLNNKSQVYAAGNLQVFSEKGTSLVGGDQIIATGDVTVVSGGPLSMNNTATINSEGRAQLFVTGNMTLISVAHIFSEEPITLVVHGNLTMNSGVQIGTRNSPWNELYIFGDLTMNYQTMLGRMDKPNLVLFMLKPDSTLTLNTEARIYGGIFAPWTRIVLGWRAAIEGAIIRQRIDASNEATFIANDILLDYSTSSGTGGKSGMLVAQQWELLR